jgi:tRNA U34 5-carboxymethylaminomethyl modifying GTPase MnmE/TrmE
MYEFNDTIVAVSSPPLGERAIVRISGPNTLDILRQIFNPPITKEKKGGVITGSIIIDVELRIDAQLYLFLTPHSCPAGGLAE